MGISDVKQKGKQITNSSSKDMRRNVKNNMVVKDINIFSFSFRGQITERKKKLCLLY